MLAVFLGVLRLKERDILLVSFERQMICLEIVKLEPRGQNLGKTFNSRWARSYMSRCSCIEAKRNNLKLKTGTNNFIVSSCCLFHAHWLIRQESWSTRINTQSIIFWEGFRMRRDDDNDTQYDSLNCNSLSLSLKLFLQFLQLC